MQNLQRDRPIAFLDLETTGLSINQDRIVELTVLKIHPDGTEQMKSERINPDMPIPPEATAIHGITDDDVAAAPRFRQYANSLLEFLTDCDIGGFGIMRFDIPLLEAEFRRIGKEFSRAGRRILDAQVIYHKLDPRDLSAAYRKYCGEELVDAHTSMADVRASALILDAQLAAHDQLPKDVEGLYEFCNPLIANAVDIEGRFLWTNGEITFNFGKYRGQLIRTIAEEDPEYVQWVSKSDFPADAKEIARRALGRDLN
jgi:DNA polymerase-3 subunit epsilon